MQFKPVCSRVNLTLFFSLAFFNEKSQILICGFNVTENELYQKSEDKDGGKK